MNNEWRFFERRAFIFEIYELIVPSISTLHSNQSDLTKEIVLLNSRLDLSSNLSSGNFQTRTSRWSAAALPQSWPPLWSRPAAGSSRSPPSTRSVEGNGGSRRPQPRPSLSQGIQGNLQERGKIEAELTRAFLEEFTTLIGGHTGWCSGISLYSKYKGGYPPNTFRKIGPECFLVLWVLTSVVFGLFHHWFQWFSMVWDHCSNDGMVSMDRSDL